MAASAKAAAGSKSDLSASALASIGFSLLKESVRLTAHPLPLLFTLKLSTAGISSYKPEQSSRQYVPVHPWDVWVMTTPPGPKTP